MYENIDKNQYTPMIRQYLTIKEQYPDTLVFYRVGDFYEMFFNDAIIASKELELVLTKKDAGVTNDPVPMAGVPYHAVEPYIQKLSDKGYRIAVVDQMEEAQANKIVDRQVSKIITPGTNIDEGYLNEKTNNYIACLNKIDNGYAFAYIDISTGDSYVTKLPTYFDAIYDEIYKLQVKEVVISNNIPKMLREHLKNAMHVLLSTVEKNELDEYFKNLYQGLNKDLQSTCIRLLNYIVDTQKRTLIHLKPFELYNNNDHLKMDYNTLRNLELITPIRDYNQTGGKKTLFNVLDECQTAMGSRLLKRNLCYPLIDQKEINRRLDIVGELSKNYLYLDDLKKSLSEIYDLERIAGRVSYGTISPKDMLQLKNSLHELPIIKALLKKMKGENLNKVSSELLEFDELYQVIDKAIREDAPYLLRDGGFIKDGFDIELDDIKNINKSNKKFLTDYELKERERTGIKNLKVAYNKVFGYYIEVSKGNVSQVKDEYGYIRKQTTVNSERYITQELKEKETLILNSRDLSIELEIKIFNQIKDEIKAELHNLQKTAILISEIDMLLSFTNVSKDYNYVRPIFSRYGEINIKNGRHPVIERNMNQDTDFIPNDLQMEKRDCILLITGPNMAGKSTYMRQTASIVIMAQIGCFVPADEAVLPIFDQIFTRIGASDDITSGDSTFMVEMKEVNYALQHATYNSLILFDEVGRGTATYDGMALAQAIIEYLSNNIDCKVLFSTHYHELTKLDESLPNLKNVHVDAVEDGEKVIFMHKVVKGATDKSFGINVASLANIPEEVIYRAKDILEKIEVNNQFDHQLMSIENYHKPQIIDKRNPEETKVINELKELKIDELKPIDALIKLEELKKELDKDE